MAQVDLLWGWLEIQFQDINTQFHDLGKKIISIENSIEQLKESALGKHSKKVSTLVCVCIACIMQHVHVHFFRFNLTWLAILGKPTLNLEVTVFYLMDEMKASQMKGVIQGQLREVLTYIHTHMHAYAYTYQRFIVISYYCKLRFVHVYLVAGPLEVLC